MLPSIFGENLFDDFFDSGFDRAFWGGRDALYGKHAKHLMKTDVKERPEEYELAVDLPGFQNDEVNVGLENGYLTIRAAKGLDKDKTDKDGKYIRQERYAGVCTRSFYVGDVKPEEIRAKYESRRSDAAHPQAGRQDRAAAQPHRNRIRSFRRGPGASKTRARPLTFSSVSTKPAKFMKILFLIYGSYAIINTTAQPLFG